MQAAIRLFGLLLFLCAVLSPTRAVADLKAGAEAYQRGDYAIAFVELRPLAEQGSAPAQFMLGLMYANGHGVGRDYQAARSWYRKAADQADPRAEHNLGMLYFEGKGVAQDYQEAHKWFHLAAERGFVPAQLMLGRIYADGRGLPKDYTKALSWYRQAAERGHPEAQFMVGFIYEGVQGVARDKKQATSWYRRAAEQGHTLALASVEKLLGPTNPALAQTLNNLAGVYKAQGKLDQAEALLLRVRKIVEGALGPQDGLARTGKRRPKSPRVSSADRAKLPPIPVPDISGMDDTIHEQVHQAESFLKSVQRKRDVSKEELSEAYGELGKLYHTYSFSEAAVLCYQNAEYLTPGDFRWPYYLGRLHEKDYGGPGGSLWAGSVQDALDSYERAVKIRPTDVPALLRLAGLRLEQDQPELAKPLFEKVLVLDNSSAAALFGLGRVAAGERDYARAVEHFERVLALQPQASGAHYRLAIVYRHLRDVARAREHLAKSGHQSPTIADPLMDEVLVMKRGGARKIDLLTRATAAYNSSDFAKATELYSKVVEADPEYPRARVQLGSALAAMGDWEAALEQYQEALRLSPTNSRAHYDIGLIHTWRGESEEAIERYRAALESDPERKQAHFQLANELMRVKRHEEAVPHYAKVVELDPRNEFAHLMHAMALVRVGHYAEARARLQESYAAFPGNPNIANALARVLAASPDEGVRDGTRALELAEQMVKTRQNLDLDHVVTFAMALAEVGQFDRAAHGQSLIISQAKDAGQQDLVDLLDDDLALYQQGKPSRLPWKPDDPVFYPVPKKMAATDLLLDTTPVEPAGGSGS